MTDKFKLRGGRAGTITFTEGVRTGHLSWEMAVGDVQMAIYVRGCWWLTPHQQRMTRDDVRRLTTEFATEAKLKIEVQFEDGWETVIPGGSS